MIADDSALPNGAPRFAGRISRSSRMLSAAVEPGSELQSTPPRAWRGVTCEPLDSVLALAESDDTTEAHPYLGATLKAKEACIHRSVTATLTTRLRRIEVTIDSGALHHEASFSSSVVFRPTRMLLPLGRSG